MTILTLHICVMEGWNAIHLKDKKTLIVFLYTYISKWTTPPLELKKLLIQAEIDGYTDFICHVNSEGGGIIPGSAIYNAIKNSSLHKVAKVDALAASMASTIICSFDRVEMAKNAKIMIHDPAGGAWGGSEDLRRVANLLDDMKSDAIKSYMGRTGLTEEALSKMMKDETWINSEKALEMGFVHAIYDADEQIDSKVKAKMQVLNSRNKQGKQSELSMARREGENPLLARFLNKVTTIEVPKNTNDMMFGDDIKKRLGLTITASDAMVEAKLVALENEAKAGREAIGELEEARQNEIAEMVEKAVTDQLITSAQKTHYLKLANGDPKTIKELFATLNPAATEVKPTAQIKPIINKDTPKDWDALLALVGNDSDKLAAWKEENPIDYTNLFKAKFG